VSHIQHNNDLPSTSSILKKSIAVTSRLREEYFG